MRTKANWARLVAAIFTMAVFYASLCSTTCAIGFCPNQVQHAANHDCERTPSHHSGQSKHQTPDNPNCSEHQHPGLYVAMSPDLQFQLSVVDYLGASAAALFPVRGLLEIFAAHPVASEHAPPIVSSVPLYDQNSVLRI